QSAIRSPQFIEAGCGRADRSADVELVTRPRTASRERLTPLYRAADGDVDDERSRRARQVAADDVHAMPRRKRGDAAGNGVEVVDRERRGKRHREKRQARRGTHGGEIAEVDGERAVADRV